MLKDIGCACCIVGHSERRKLFGETNEEVNRKVRARSIEADIAPIICVGESLSVRDGGTTVEFVTRPGARGLAGMDAATRRRRVVAYEPIWAIGTGRTATPEQAEEVCAAIRATAGGHVRRRARREPARALRRLDERGQRRALLAPARHRRRPRRRREP